jgi:hypothetical protein
MSCKNDAPGMVGCRSRDKDGQLRTKREDTHVATIEKHYGVDLGVRGDTHLGTLLEKRGVNSLDELLRK